MCSSLQNSKQMKLSTTQDKAYEMPEKKQTSIKNGYFIRNPSEDVAEDIAKWLGFLATDHIRFDIDECHHLIDGAYNVMLVEGAAEGIDRMEKALDIIEQKAMSIVQDFDFISGDRYLIQICDNTESPIVLEEMKAIQCFLSSLPESSDVAWGLSKQETGNKIRIRLAVANLKRT